MTERAVLLLRRRRPIGEPPALAPGPTPGYAVLQGSSGAGRVRVALAEHGVETATLEQAVIDQTATPSDIGALDRGRRYDTVVLGSHFVNSPDAPLRAALLAAARRHVTATGEVLVEHHPVDWTETAAPTPPTPGSEVGMEDVRVDPPFVRAVSTYDAAGRFERVPFEARVLSEAELDVALAAAGLRRRRRLGPTWLEAAPA